jgi:hypothetical protein
VRGERLLLHDDDDDASSARSDGCKWEGAMDAYGGKVSRRRES